MATLKPLAQLAPGVVAACITLSLDEIDAAAKGPIRRDLVGQHHESNQGRGARLDGSRIARRRA